MSVMEGRNSTILGFCEKMRKKHSAAECRSFSGRVEALAALFDAIQLAPKDCVYVSALAPSEVIRVILFFGAVPVFCDVNVDSFCLDHRSLESSVRSTMNVDRLYPRAVIAENFCGVPFALRAVKDICDRMGLILIEDCGSGYGGISDGRLCGSVGDYALVGLGASSLFGTGGSGSLILAYEGSPLSENLAGCDGSGYQTADEIYAPALDSAFRELEDRLEKSRAALNTIREIMKDSDFWVQRCGGRYSPSCTSAVFVGQDESSRDSAIDCFRKAGMSAFVRKLHSHGKSCFDRCSRGIKLLENAPALAPRSFVADIAGALNAGKIDGLTRCFRKAAEITSD